MNKILEQKIDSEPTVLKQDLKERGWTDSMVKKFYPVPFQIKKRSGGGKYNLYILSKVEEIEKTDQFKQALEKSCEYRERAEKGNDTKYERVSNEAEEILKDFTVREIEYEKLKLLALESKNLHRQDKGNYSDFQLNPQNETRIISNYIRHELTNYDYLLSSLEGKAFYYEIVKSEIEYRIRKVYPFYESNDRPAFHF
ncbi:MAG TPA: hypothetical protein PKK94_25415 [Leptospiraceae bacterium]|nr:hypothetical protein [Leptospiraceae bacterium]